MFLLKQRRSFNNLYLTFHVGYLESSITLFMPSEVTPNFFETSIKTFCFDNAEQRPGKLSSSGPGPGQVQVRSRSGPGQVQVRSGQVQVRKVRN